MNAWMNDLSPIEGVLVDQGPSHRRELRKLISRVLIIT
jgi:hypothetical protein